MAKLCPSGVLAFLLLPASLAYRPPQQRQAKGPTVQATSSLLHRTSSSGLKVRDVAENQDAEKRDAGAVFYNASAHDECAAQRDALQAQIASACEKLDGIMCVQDAHDTLQFQSVKWWQWSLVIDLFDRGKQPIFWAGFHNKDTSGVGKKTHLEEFIRSVNGFQLEETQWGQMIKSKGVSRLDACPSKRIKMNYWRVASTALAEAMSQRHTSKVLVAVNKDFSGRWSLYRSILWQAELLSMAESLRKNPEWNPVFTVYDVKGTCSSALGPAVKYHLENLAGRRVRVMCFDCSRGLPSATSGQACSRQQEVLESEAPRRSCVEGDCQNGWGWAEWPTGDVYKGDFRDGQPNGRGSSQAPDGSAYEGDWKDGEKHGQGTLRFAQGAVYSGSYKNNLEDGFGTYRFSNGGIYKGHFKLGTMNGNGLMVFANGARYDGHWKDGKKDGVGTFTWPSGNIYVGAWKDDEMAGSL